MHFYLIQINGVSVTGLTRQEVVMRLTSIPHSVELLLANKPSEYSELFTNSDTLCGDELFIRSNVSYMPKNSEKDLRLTMNPGDVFKVIDTLPEDSKGKLYSRCLYLTMRLNFYNFRDSIFNGVLRLL